MAVHLFIHVYVCACVCVCMCVYLHDCVCVCVYCLLPSGLCVLVFIYVCISVCYTDRLGSAPTGKEVGAGIDKAVNEVIGRINRDPKGTMIISSCQSVCLSVCLSGEADRRVGC